MLVVMSMELKYDKEGNRRERIEFIHYYAGWVKSVSNEVWSRQQAELIDSFMLNAKNFQMTPERYLEMVDRRRIKRRGSYYAPEI